MHDPFQNYQTFGAYPGMTTPQHLAYGNPLAGLNPLAAQGVGPIGQPFLNPVSQMGYPGIGYGNIHPLQLQLALLAGASPWTSGLQNPLIAATLQNPLLGAGVQNPGVQNPVLHALLAQQHGGFGNFQNYPQTPIPFGGQQAYQQSPFQQLGQGQFGLAPQTPLGWGGQINPLLAQPGIRGFQTPGIGPWAGY